MLRICIYIIASLLIGITDAVAQFPEFMMSDTTVTECDAFLGDSGGPDESYGINEDFVFTVNTGGIIEVSFLTEICIEDGFDFLNIYDGLTTAAPLITSITGAGFIPPDITSSGGALTFEFISDGSASYCGFYLFWDTTVGPPDVPEINVNELPMCGTQELLVDFSFPIGCDWVLLDSVHLSGASDVFVTSVQVLCNNGSGSTALLTTETPFDYNCDYNLDIGLAIPDECDSVWNFNVSTIFQYNACPVNVELIASETEICVGQCIDIEAIVEGCYDYTFEWTPTLPNSSGPHNVCLDETTTFTVEVIEVQTGQTGSGSITITVEDSGIITPDQTLCQSVPGFLLEANTPGGEWIGNGIQDPETGFFEPDSASSGINIIYYVSNEVCYDSVLIDITPIDAGLEYAACPGSPPFQLVGIPGGGTWTGDYTLPDGSFDPAVEGSHLVFYMVNGCQDSSYVNVETIVSSLPQSTFCQSEWTDTLEFSPLGGTWTGPGIVDSYYGIFDPSSVDGGNYSLTYNINGCGQVFPITINEIYTGQRTRTSCPDEAPFIPQPDFSPTGGYWEGTGIIDMNSGEYDPGSIPNDFWTGLVYFAPNGCTDTIFYYNRQTEILFDGEGHICLDNDPIPLTDDVVGNVPWGGEWTGNGVVYYGDDYYEFTPSNAGIGNHIIHYEVNGCSDSMVVNVYPNQLNVDSYSLCSNEPAFVLDPDLPLGGTWFGLGISDQETGLFDPQIATPGDNWVYWNTLAGCTDSVLVEIEEYQEAFISNLDSVYCYQDEDFIFDVFPENGILTGATGDNSFNPAVSGPGDFLITYTWSGQECFSEFSQTVTVYPSIEVELTASEEIICPGGSSSLLVSSIGGQPETLYQYQWSDDLFPVANNVVSPLSTQYFYVEISDGCSSPVLDSVLIEVLPPLQVQISTSELVCFGDSGYITTDLGNPEYDVQFNGMSLDTLYGIAGQSVNLFIEDLTYGCTKDSLLVIPSFSPVTALFSPNPNISCIPWDEQPVTFIDLSQYGLSGTWEFGNGESMEYGAENPVISYNTAGNYNINLSIENEGGCMDSAEVEICILDPTRLFVPDIFSPNNDGINDILIVRGQGIVAMEFLIFSQWGQLVFRSTNPEVGWDGQLHGSPSPSGVYAYQLSAQMNDGSNEVKSGNVTLIR